MRRTLPIALVGALVAALPLVFGDPPTPLPAPTEHVLDAESEERLREGRKAWIEEMHYAAPGTDWRAIERENGERAMERRRNATRGGVSSWLQLGSRNLAGRMHVAALSADGDSLYGGSSLGGVWKADLNGQGWRPLADNLYGGGHELAVAAGPPETVTRSTSNGLLHYTQDGGQTWLEPTGPINNRAEIKTLRTDPSNTNRAYLVLRKNSGLWKAYRSDDGGLTYTLIRGMAGVGDLWLDRVSGGRIYLVEGSSIAHSDDFGANWTSVGTLPVTPTDVMLFGSEAGAPTLFAGVRQGSGWSLYRSTDAGATWALRGSMGDLSNGWRAMTASISDPDVVMYGGVEAWRSTNGGSSFTRVNTWGAYYGDPVHMLHADIPGLDVVRTPQEDEIFFISTDGGVYRSDDLGDTWTNLSLEYLGISQYYSTHTSINDPDRILAGAQDQGYQRSTGPAVGDWRDFDQLISGDYGHLTSSDGEHAWVYSVYPGFVLTQKGEINPVLSTSLDFPSGENYSWMPFIVADRDRRKTFWFCATHLWEYEKIGTDPWTMTQHPQDFTVNGGAYLTAHSISPVDHDVRLSVTSSGVLWYSSDGGASWTVSADDGPSSHYFYGTALEPSPLDANVAVAGGSGYSGPAAYRTTDGGVTWTAIGDGLPSTLIYDLAFESPSSEVLYAATEAGPYRLPSGGTTWEYIGGTDAPLTTYWSVEAVPAAGARRFGTYGRGIWDHLTSAATSVEELTAELPASETQQLRNYPNPFTAKTMLRFTVKRAGDVRLTIYDTAGRRVREITNGSRAVGVHQAEWDGRDASGKRVVSGLYIARLEADGEARVRRMTLVR